jgi:hypothetical protein
MSWSVLSFSPPRLALPQIWGLHLLRQYGHYIYCDCAGCLYSSYDFQCTNAQHGPAFQRYDQELLLKLLTALEPSPELNILILGEIGSGKDHLYQRIHQLPKIRNTSRWNE